MRFANPSGLVLLALALPVLAAHVLRPRRAQVSVSSVLLWRRLERPVSAARPWQRLRWSLLLLAQLLAVVLLALAVSRPERLDAAGLTEHTVFIVDASGSMAATDGSPDRLADAKEEADALRRDLPDDGVASVVVAGDVPRVALTASGDDAEFDRALRTIDQGQARPDFADAFALAESLETGETPIGFVLVTDGGLTAAEAALVPAGTRVVGVGSAATNRAITRLTVEPRDGQLHARVTVRNTGGPTATQSVRVDVDGVTSAAADVTLRSGEQRDVELDVPAGDLVEAFLDGDDLLSVDDHAVAVTARRGQLRVLIVGDPLFWQELLTSVPGVTVDVAASVDEAATANQGAPPHDLTVYSGVDVPGAPPGPFVAVAPPAGVTVPAGVAGTGVAVSGSVENPAVTLVRTDDPLLAGLDLAEVAIASAQQVTAGPEILVAGEGAPLVLRGELGGHRYAYLAFGLRDSNLAVQVAFPLLGDRLLGELTGRAVPGEALEVGARLPVPSNGGEVVGPDARTGTVSAGEAAPRAWRAGFWTIRAEDGPDIVVAVNAPTSESALAPAAVTAPPAVTDGRREPAEQATSVLAWLLWPLLVLVAAEAYLAWRRVGVTRRQWCLALGLRATVAGLLLIAIVDPTLRRSSDRVATVFVVDASASVGGTGSAASEIFVAEAIAARSGEATAGVVVFGGDAHVDQVMAAVDRYGGSDTIVDETATDVAAGLRLGAALLPTDARRRLVLLSDGSANEGDLTEELESLRGRGVPVDVVTLPGPTGPDVAITGVDVPRAARAGELVPVVVSLQSAASGPATVTLRRDGIEVATQSVDLTAGANIVRFEDDAAGAAAAAAGAVLRYQAVVSSPADSIADNDVGFAAVPIEGPARVLVVEGSPGEAETLVAALNAGGVGTEVVGVADLPAVERLVTYAGVVLADVDARTLSGAQVDSLTTAVRDLGRGLVTIGGTQSYGVGGYRESPLSDLLPVDSEITDPERRRTVAEVLSIDTSESMSACHCRDGDMTGGQMTEGGVNKTDISRAAAERTIEALAATDEVGVLAWNSSAEWVIDLQQLPPADVVDEGLRSLQPAGQTDIRESLGTAAEALLDSDAELKHIILFSDGFTDQRLIEATADEAGELYAEHGITTSVLATGEGAAPSLEAISVAGNGRFYAGTDLEAVPEIMAEEAVIASRNFVNEGEFLPEVTSDDAVVRDLVASPPLSGYVATTAKGQASTLLRIGPDRDPLLATWQAGLGRVTSWTSDANNWSAGWSAWTGSVDFWSRVVKDTLPAGDDAGAVQASVRDGRLRVSVEGDGPFADGATSEVRVSGPDGQSETVTLDRTAAGRFEGETDAPRSGSYAVGASVLDAAGAVELSSSTLATNSYPAEFVPGTAGGALLTRIAAGTGGRTDIAAAEAWNPVGLPAGTRIVQLLGPLLLAAALAWPVAVLVGLISLRGTSVASTRAGLVSAAGRAARRLRDVMPSIGGFDPDDAPAPDVAPASPPPSRPPSPSRPPPRPSSPEPEQPPSRGTVEDLLARQRARRRRDPD